MKFWGMAVPAVAVAGGSYRAAVVEFAPETAKHLETLDAAGATALKLRNVAALEAFAKTAKANGTQIMVWPEYGITGDGGTGNGADDLDFNRSNVGVLLEELPNVTNPCSDPNGLGNRSPAIARASCVAKELELVLVINLLTRTACKPGILGCPGDGMFLHNTAIAFAEDGEILSHYHKRHPYGDETAFVDPGDATMKGGVTFVSSFGVKFGMFICFDMVFFTDGGPDALEIVYPTDWVNDALGPLPDPITAHRAQRFWSGLHRKNLLAANYGGFAKDSSGSGIWHSGQPLAQFYNPTEVPESKLLIADVPVLTNEVVV